ncbi:MAG: hypothetical protein IT293_08165 [Deltaproteobacteria bacterium]|nr:hypothetical protein [Deltaproteobacteria bacterium]
MRLVRLMTVVASVALSASRGLAQVSCADPDNLCTGDPCTITTVAVQSPCVVDFGARDLIIAGTIDVPDGGTLDFTAKTILQQGPIDGRHVGNGVGNGAAVVLESTVGDIELRGEIDATGTAASGSIDVTAAGNLLVKDNLNAKTSGANVTATGGTITLTAGGTIETDQTAVVDAQGGDTTAGGTISIAGVGNVVVKGRVRAEGLPGGTITIGSTAGSVTAENHLRVGSPLNAGTINVGAASDVTLREQILASGSDGDGGDVLIATPNGNVTIEDKVRVGGETAGGSFMVSAPSGTVTISARIQARAGIGGLVDVSAATIVPKQDIDARGRTGDGGTVELTATTAVDLVKADIDASGKVNGGAITLAGGPVSGDVTVDSSKLRVKGSSGTGGLLTVSAAGGAVTIGAATVELTAKTAGGQATIDGVGITVGQKTRFLGRDGGEVRFAQSGAGTFSLAGAYDVRSGGVVEALAPSGSLTASGKATTGGGCVGMSAGGTLDTTLLNADVAITPSCP